MMRRIGLALAFLTAATSAWPATPSPISILTGQAFVQTSSGAPRTCAGQDDVLLLPETATDLIAKYFAATSVGFRPVGNSELPVWPIAKSATCDAGGNFKFMAVAPGTYFVLSKITWAAGQQGGIVMRRVEVPADVTVQTILAGNVDDSPMPPPRDARELVAERAIAARLFDPNSATFEWSGRWNEDVDFKTWRWSQPVHGDVSCGRLNARNRMGGYVGRTTFLVVVANGGVALLNMDSSADTELTVARLMCQKSGFF